MSKIKDNKLGGCILKFNLELVICHLNLGKSSIISFKCSLKFSGIRRPEDYECSSYTSPTLHRAMPLYHRSSASAPKFLAKAPPSPHKLLQ